MGIVTRGDELDLGGDDDETVLVCVRVADFIGTVAPRSEIIMCDVCSRLVWIGPYEYALASQGSYYDRVICARCAVDEVNRRGGR